MFALPPREGSAIGCLCDAEQRRLIGWDRYRDSEQRPTVELRYVLLEHDFPAFTSVKVLTSWEEQSTALTTTDAAPLQAAMLLRPPVLPREPLLLRAAGWVEMRGTIDGRGVQGHATVARAGSLRAWVSRYGEMVVAVVTAMPFPDALSLTTIDLKNYEAPNFPIL